MNCNDLVAGTDSNDSQPSIYYNDRLFSDLRCKINIKIASAFLY